MKNTLLVGLGGAGINIANYVKGYIGCDALAINTDASALKQNCFESNLLIGPEICKGKPAGTLQRGFQAAKESTVELEKALSHHQTLVMIAGLGGGTGTGALTVVSKLSLSLGKQPLVIVSLPFGFESDRRETAFAALKKLEQIKVKILVYDNQTLLEDPANRNKALQEVFEESNKKIAEGIQKHLEIKTV